MALFKFHDDDIFINTIEAYPEFRFMVHSGAVVIDNVPDMSGSVLDNIHGTTSGHVSLYQSNIDRPIQNRQHAKILKAGYRHSLKTFTPAEHNVWFNYDGEFLTSSYNHSASISRNYFDSSSPANRLYLRAIKNSLNEI